MRLWFRRRVRYTGSIKVVETTGTWGVYAGERIVLGDGRSIDDDLGIRIRKIFQPGAEEALKRGESLSEAFEMRRVKITIEEA